MFYKVIAVKISITSAELDLTTNCKTGQSLSCHKNCTYFHAKKLNHVLSVQDAFKMFKIFRDLGIDTLRISGGGEPLENPDANQIFNYANIFGMRTTLITNGVLLKNFISSTMVHNLYKIRISLPPVWKTDDFFKYYAEFINFYTMCGKQEMVSLSALVQPNTKKEHVRSIIDFALKHNIYTLRLKPMHFLNRGRFNLDASSYKQVHDILLELKHKHKKELDIEFPKLTSLLGIAGLKSSYNECNFNQLVIGADANIYNCCETKYKKEHKIGHYSEFLNSIYLNAVQSSPQKITKHCFSGCVGHYFNMTGKHIPQQ